ncbi:MAG TPA: hypothetical protein VI521_01370, partial [Candidatus Babeliales bacterium]|nr:hypothetical protein [Candidatus Babeliales bacterium]
FASALAGLHRLTDSKPSLLDPQPMLRSMPLLYATIATGSFLCINLSIPSEKMLFSSRQNS